MPILFQLKKQELCHPRVMQFSWAAPEEVLRIKKLSEKLGIPYTHQVVYRKPHPAFGTIFTAYKGVLNLRKYLEIHPVDIVMPRSTLPAFMVNRLAEWLKAQGIKIIFDADGFPLAERVDFSGLKKSSRQYTYLKKEEDKMLDLADRVLCRSQKAIGMHVAHVGKAERFFKVTNGRNAKFFTPNSKLRQQARASLNLEPDAVLWIYVGSLGPQYLLDEMLGLFAEFHRKHPNSKFLCVTRQHAILEAAIPADLADHVLGNSAPYSQIPEFLAAADVGLSLRKAAPSLAGVAPIKLGEYLLMGLPVIASKGVGDTERILEGNDFCFLYEGDKDACLGWVVGIGGLNRKKIREFGLTHFSLARTVADYEVALRGL